jgi:hypothetical protein
MLAHYGATYISRRHLRIVEGCPEASEGHTSKSTSATLNNKVGLVNRRYDPMRGQQQNRKSVLTPLSFCFAIGVIPITRWINRQSLT